MIKTLARHNVAFVMIGGLAARALGSPSVTDDMDICYERTPQNMEALANALRELGARLRGVDEDVPFLLDAETIARGDHFTFITESGSIDCLGTPAGSAGYDALAARAQKKDLFGYETLVAHIDDLMCMKRAAGRPKDLTELAILEALQRELEIGEQSS